MRKHRFWNRSFAVLLALALAAGSLQMPAIAGQTSLEKALEQDSFEETAEQGSFQEEEEQGSFEHDTEQASFEVDNPEEITWESDEIDGNAEEIEKNNEELSEISEEIPEDNLGEIGTQDSFQPDLDRAAAQESFDTGQRETYTVTLDANGGLFQDAWDDVRGEWLESSEVLQKVIVAGSAVDTFPIRMQDSAEWTFAGWSLEKDGSLVSCEMELYVPSESSILYAVWEEIGEAFDEKEEAGNDSEELPSSESEEKFASEGTEIVDAEAAETSETELEEIPDLEADEKSDVKTTEIIESEAVEGSDPEVLRMPDPEAREMVDPEMADFPAGATDGSTASPAENFTSPEESASSPEENVASLQESASSSVGNTSTGEDEISITLEPGDVKADYGTMATFESSAKGESLSCQWYYRESGSQDWILWKGRSQTFFYLFLSEEWDGREIMCRFRDSAGREADSRIATITVLPVFDISSYTYRATVEKETGEEAVLSAPALGKGLSYQWYYKKNGENIWLVWEGMTSPEETVTVLDEYDGMSYDCIVTAENGSSISLYDYVSEECWWSMPKFTIKRSLENNEEITLYSIGEVYQQYISLPSDLSQTYSLQGHEYEILEGKTVAVEDGIVKPKEMTWYYHQLPSGMWVGSTEPSGEEGEVVQKQFEYGDTVIRVDGEKDITFHTVSYETEYAQQVADAWIEEHVDDSMSDYEKAEQCCIFVSKFDYGTQTSSMTGMIISGAGDCWASTSTLLYMLKKLGIPAKSRSAGYDAGAGSGHQNVIALLDGLLYILDAGYTGTGPRHYSMTTYGTKFTYAQVSSGKIEITGYLNLDNEEEVQVPAMIDGKTVVGIGKGGFSYQYAIKKLTLPDTLQYIEEDAFKYADSLENILIPDGVTRIGAGAFQFCHVLKQVRIPASVKEIGRGCFFDCTSLETIRVEATNAFFEDEDGVLFEKGKKALVAFPAGKRGPYTMPEEVEILRELSFSFAKPKELILSDSLRTIEPYAFYDSNIIRLELPLGMMEVGTRAFQDSYIREFVLPEGVETISEYAFFNASVREIHLPTSLKSIGEAAFAGNISLCRTVVPASVTVIGDYAFWLDYGWSSMGESTNLNQQYGNYVLLEGATNLQFGENGVFRDCIVGVREESPACQYVQEKEVPFVLLGADAKILLQDAWFVSLENISYAYKGKEIRPVKTASYEIGKCPVKLMENVDYKVSYKDNINAGTAQAAIIGTGVFSGTLSRSFTILEAYQWDAKAFLSRQEVGVGHQASVRVENAIGDISFRSSNERIASVDQDGIVTGVSEGTTSIYVTAAGNQNYGLRSLYLQITVTPENHSWDNGRVTRETSCREAGIETWTCIECGATKTNEIPAKSHTPVSELGAAATCTKPGLTDWSHCMVCGTVLQKQEIIPALGHEYSAWKTITPATYNEEGLQERTCGRCKDTEQKTIAKLQRPSINDAAVSGIIAKTYTGKAQIQSTVVSLAGNTLAEGTDYTVSYLNNIKAGTATITITGIGNYKDALTKTFTINQASITNATITGIKNKTYTSKEITQTPVVKVNNNTLKLNTDYKLTYKNNTKAGTATVTITGKGNYKDTVVKTFKINKATITKAAVTCPPTKVFAGWALTPIPTLKLGSKTLKKGTDYTLAFKNNKNVGVATITITGKGNYTGTIKKTFVINPMHTTISKLLPSNGAITVNWKKQAAQTSGYQIQYSSRSDFKTQKTVKVSGASKVSKKISGLTKKHKYYVRVRTYKTVGSKNYFSTWSAAKTVKTK